MGHKGVFLSRNVIQAVFGQCAVVRLVFGDSESLKIGREALASENHEEWIN